MNRSPIDGPSMSADAGRTDAQRQVIRDAHLVPEGAVLDRLVGLHAPDAGLRARASARGAALVRTGAQCRPARADGGVPRRIRPVDAGRRGADVPGRGAAAGARCRHHRRADRGQDRALVLGPPSGPVVVEPRQRLDLGADADRRGAARRRRAGGGAEGRDPPAGRAGDPRRRRPGDEGDWGRSSCWAAPSTRRWSAAASGPPKATPTPTTCWARRR